MPGETVKVTFQVDDQGNVLLDRFNKSLGRIEDGVGRVNSSLRLVKWDSFVNLASRAASAAERIYDLARSTASAANEIERQAEIAGVDIETLQKLQYAAKMTDVSNESLARGLKILSVNMGEAVQGTGKARDYFEALGISMNDLKAKSPVDILLKIADKFARAEDGARKMEYATALLGSRFGTEMILMLNKGGAGIKALGDEAVKMGTILGEVVIKKGSEADRIFKKIELQVNALKISLAPLALEVAKFFEGLMPKLERLKVIIDEISLVGRGTMRMLEDLGILSSHTLTEAEIRAQKAIAASSAEAALGMAAAGITPAPSAKKVPLPGILSDEERRQLIEDARQAMTLRLEEIKNQERLEKERVATQMASQELAWKQGLIGEKEYLDSKNSLETDAITYSIGLSNLEKEAINEGYRVMIRWSKEKSEKIKLEGDQKKALQKIDDDGMVKQEQLNQLTLKGYIDLIEFNKKVALAESEGRLKIMEEEINKQKELNDLQVGLGTMRAGAATLFELDSAKQLTQEKIRHLELERSLEPSTEKQKSLTSDILALNIQLEDVEKRRLKLLPEFGTFLEGWNIGLKQYLVSLGTTFEQGVELAKKSSQLMEQALSDFLYSGEFKFKTFLDSLRRMLADFQAKQIMQTLIGKETSTGTYTGGLLGSLTTWVKGLFSGGGTTTGATTSTGNLYNWQLAEATGGGGTTGIGSLLGGTGGGTIGAIAGTIESALQLLQVTTTAAHDIYAKVQKAENIAKSIGKLVGNIVGIFTEGALSGIFGTIGSYLGQVQNWIVMEVWGNAQKEKMIQEYLLEKRMATKRGLEMLGFEFPERGLRGIGKVFGYSPGRTKEIMEAAAQLYENIVKTVASAFQDSIDTGKFKDFEKKLRQSVFDSIQNGMIVAFSTAGAITKALAPLEQFITKSISAALKEGFDIEAFKAGIMEKWGKIEPVIAALEPIFNALAGVNADIKSLILGTSLAKSSGGMITIPSFQHGGVMPYTGLAYVHKNEPVGAPPINIQMRDISIGNGMDVQMVGRRLARMVWWATKKPIVFG